MNIESRLATVKRALRLLVEQMRADDSIGIVTFGSDARVVLPPTTGNNKERILRTIDGLKTDGSTSIDAGLREGFKIADQAFKPGQINMLLLCTDGVANNGVSDAEACSPSTARSCRRAFSCPPSASAWATTTTSCSRSWATRATAATRTSTRLTPRGGSSSRT